MKTMEVRKQVRLPMTKCIELVLNGVRFRLFRAMVTVVIIALAAAFLMTMLSESLIGRASQLAIDRQLEPLDRFLFWSSRLAFPLSHQKLTDELAAIEPGGPRWTEFAAWGNLDDEQLKRLESVAQRERRYLRFFDQLNEGIRRVLIGRRKGAQIFAYLQDPEARTDFLEDLKQAGQKMPTSSEKFQAFLQDWGRTRPLRGRISAGNNEAVSRINEFLGSRPPKEALAQPSDAFLEALDEAGFVIRPDELKSVRQQAALAVDAERIGTMLSVQTIKTRLANRENSEIADVDKPTLYETLSSSDGAEWFVDLIGELKGKLQEIIVAHEAGESLKAEQQKLLSQRKLLEGFAYSADRVEEVASRHRRQTELANIQSGRGRPATMGLFGFSRRVRWLIVVSFLVCVVGIANAMLMSVTERFREIATMKCLGATDGFIQTNFILESVIQGIAGGAIGTILGLLLGMLRSSAKYGGLAFVHFPGAEVLQAAGISLGVAILVSSVAAMYPARVAAKLAPMEAMRIE